MTRSCGVLPDGALKKQADATAATSTSPARPFASADSRQGLVYAGHPGVSCESYSLVIQTLV
eukprot:4539227-Amphidinium_carterae.1